MAGLPSTVVIRDPCKWLTWSAAVSQVLVENDAEHCVLKRARYGAGICAVLPRFAFGRKLSLVLTQFSGRLFFSAQSTMWSNSAVHDELYVSQFSAVTIIRYVSSANLTMELPSCTGRRSAAVIKYDAGPRPDPCMTLARMLANVDNSPEYFVECVRGRQRNH